MLSKFAYQAPSKTCTAAQPGDFTQHAAKCSARVGHGADGTPSRDTVGAHQDRARGGDAEFAMDLIEVRVRTGLSGPTRVDALLAAYRRQRS
jgi:hypothetical protein